MIEIKTYSCGHTITSYVYHPRDDGTRTMGILQPCIKCIMQDMENKLKEHDSKTEDNKQSLKNT